MKGDWFVEYRKHEEGKCDFSLRKEEGNCKNCIQENLDVKVRVVVEEVLDFHIMSKKIQEYSGANVSRPGPCHAPAVKHIPRNPPKRRDALRAFLGMCAPQVRGKIRKKKEGNGESRNKKNVLSKRNS